MIDELTRERIERLTPEAVASRLLQPERPLLQAAIEAVGQAESPEDAWSALIASKLIPSSWHNGPQRAFLQVPDSNLRVSSNGQAGPPRSPLPPTVKACISVASVGYELLEQCEQHARQAYLGLEPWHFLEDEKHLARPTALFWDVLPVNGFVPEGTRAPGQLRTASFFAREAVRARAPGLFREKDLEFRDRNESIQKAARERSGLRFSRWHLVADHAWWNLAVDLDLVVPKRLTDRDHGLGKASSKVRGTPFRKLDDPFLPVWAIWLTGVGFAGCDLDFELHLARIP